MRMNSDAALFQTQLTSKNESFISDYVQIEEIRKEFVYIRGYRILHNGNKYMFGSIFFLRILNV